MNIENRTDQDVSDLRHCLQGPELSLVATSAGRVIRGNKSEYRYIMAMHDSSGNGYVITFTFSQFQEIVDDFEVARLKVKE